MTDTWTTHYKGTIEGRPVEVQTYSEGGFRVTTTQGADYEGDVSVEESSTIIVPPSAAGSQIEIDGETIEDVREQLREEGFSEGAIGQIIGRFPTT